MSKRRTTFRQALFSAAVATLAIQSVSAQTTWLNASTDFATVGNWSSGVPTSATLAVFPASGTPVNPGVSFGTQSALGLSIDNTLGNYNFTSDGSGLDLYASGITQTGGSTQIDSGITLQANQTFNIGTGATLLTAAAINVNGKQLTKAGDGTLILSGGDAESPIGPQLANRLIVNGGTVRILSSSALGNAAAGTYFAKLNTGATLEIKPTAATISWGLAFDTSLGTVGGGWVEMATGSTIRGFAGNTGAESAIFGGGRSPRVVNGSTVTFDSPDANGAVVFQSFLGNVTETLASSGSKINLTGSGQMYFSGGTVGANAYTGSWEVNMTLADFGLAILNSPAAFGQRTGGVAAPVTLTDGFTADMRSGGASGNITNPFTMNGGVLALSQAFEARAAAAQWNGSMTVNNLASGGSFIRLSEVFSGVAGAKNMDANQAGVFGGDGLLSVFGNTALGAAGTVFLKNTSTVTPNTFSGVVQVSAAANLDASTIPTGSNPLGTGQVTLTGGGLILNHSGAGTITTYASNVVLVASSSATNTNGTITVGNGGNVTVGSAVQLGLLQFDNTGPGGNQTVIFGNASATSNYSVSLANLNTGTTGTSTLTAGANPANVAVRGVVLGGGSIVKTGNNTVTFNSIDRTAVNAFSGGIAVSGGTLAFNAISRINSLDVSSGGFVKVNAGGTKLLRVSSLNIDAASNVDVADNDLVVDGGSAASTRSSLQSGVSGNGIKSSTNTGNPARSIGYATGAQLGGAFRGETLSAGDIVVHPTFKGDANLDGKTNTVDFNVLAGNFGASAGTAVWTEGDFTYDGNINSVDFTNLVAGYGNQETLGTYAGPLPGAAIGNDMLEVVAGRIAMLQDSAIASGTTDLRDSGKLFNDGGTAPSLGAAVPEPASLSLIALVGAGLLGRRRRD